jgi:hypothetical protein
VLDRELIHHLPIYRVVVTDLDSPGTTVAIQPVIVTERRVDDGEQLRSAARAGDDFSLQSVVIHRRALRHLMMFLVPKDISVPDAEILRMLRLNIRHECLAEADETDHLSGELRTGCPSVLVCAREFDHAPDR